MTPDLTKKAIAARAKPGHPRGPGAIENAAILDLDPQCAASKPSSRASALALQRAAVALHRGTP